MKKLVHPEFTSRRQMSRGANCKLSAARRAVFAAFGLDDYEGATLLRIRDRSPIRPGAVVEVDFPDNIVWITTLPAPRQKA